MRRLAILGASGHGKVVADAALAGGWDQVVFYDDKHPVVMSVGPWSVYGTRAELIDHRARFTSAIVAIGDNRARLELHQALLLHRVPMASVIHPNAAISRFATIRSGCMIAAGAVVSAFAEIGDAAIVNTGASVDHDCVLGAGVHIGPGSRLGGNVTIGERAWVGIGASIRQDVAIGCDAVVGGGAMVVRPVAAGEIVAGVPARRLR